MSELLKLTLNEFHDRLKAQGSAGRENLVFKCPICSTLQSAADIIKARGGKSFEDVEKYIGFSCIGRFTHAGPHQKDRPPGRGCDWTLGGLLCIRHLDVIDEEGKAHPHFMPATPEEALAHWRATGAEIKEGREVAA